MRVHKFFRKNGMLSFNDNPLKQKKDLSKATTTIVRLGKPGEQNVFLRYYSGRFALSVEDSFDHTDRTVKQAPVLFASPLFSTSQLKVPTHCEDFLAAYFALE